MANDKDFKVKNNIQAAAYNETVGTVTTTTEGYNLENATYDVVTLSVASQEGNPSGLTFNNNGTKLFIIGTAGDEVNEYSLSTAWDVSTASYVQNFSVSSQQTAPRGIFFKSDGDRMYIVGTTSAQVSQYNIGSSADATITWPASIEWAEGIAATTPANGQTDLYTISTDDGGTTYIGLHTADNLS